MARRRMFLMLLSLCILPIASFSQNITLNVLLNPNPSPYISEWKSNPAALGSLVIANQTGPRDVRIRASISREGSGVVFKCLTGRLRITNAATLTADKFLRFDDVTYPNEGFRNIVVQSGRLPEGSYNLCLKIEDVNGIALSVNSCGNFIINYPAQPQLIAPMNNGEQLFQTTTFQWTPVLVPGTYAIHYVLKIAELLQGQSPNQALNSNYPFFLKEDLQTNMFLYVNSGQPFQAGKKYAWQVQVLDQFGLPPATNQGKSEIFVFTYKSSTPVPVKRPKITAPSNNGTVTSLKPVFQWSYDLHGTLVNYKISAVPIDAYETAEHAMQAHSPIFAKTVKGISSFTPAADLPFVNNGNYALRIQVVNDDASVAASSDAFTFKYLQSQPVLASPVNNGVVYYYKHEFKWSDAFYSTSVKYRLKVAVLNGGQNPGSAMANNPPVYTKTVTGVLSHIPDTNIPFKENQKYVYAVSALDNADNVVAASGVNVFTFNGAVEHTSTVAGNVYYEFADPGEYLMQDMNNVLIKLVVRHIVKVKSKTKGKQTVASSGEIDISDEAAVSFKDNNKVLGWCGTGSGGGFSFTFNNKDSLGQLVKKDHKMGSTSGEFIDYIQGDVYKVARIMLTAPANYYYTSPSNQIAVNPGKSVTIGQAVCYVRSYRTVFTMKPQVNNKNQVSQLPISDMIVYLLRKNRPSLVPKDEGKPRPSPQANLWEYEIIAKGVSSINTADLGRVVFSRMVRNRDNNDDYYIYAKSDPEKGFMNYETPKVPVKFTFPADTKIFADQYAYPTVYKDIYATPLPPSVWGVVTRTDNGAPMKDAKVYLYKNDVVESMHYTGTDGYFPKFTNLPVALDAYGNINGPRRDIVVGKAGYQTYKNPIVGKGQNEALLLGEKSFKVVNIKPGMNVQGSIVDETGSGVNAEIKIGEGPFVAAVSAGYYPDPNHWNPAKFSCAAEVNYDLPVIIHPKNHAYFDEQLTVNTIGWNEPKQFTVYKKLHRIKVYVTERTGGEFPPPIHKARVRLKVQNGWYDKTAAANSNSVEFSFENDDSTYAVEVLPPEGKYYEPLKTTLTNSASKSTKFYSLALRKASFVSGRVVVGTEKNPVPSAHVYIEQGNSLVEAYTNVKGEFLLKNVPVNVPVTIWASKHSTNTTYIGDSVKMTVPPAGKANLEFRLTTYDGIDITNLFGFPIEVASLNDQSGKIRIKGRFSLIPKNNQFALSDPQETIGFDSVYIKPSAKIRNSMHVPIAEPVGQIVQTNRNSLDIKIFNTFSAVIYDNKIGVHLVDAGTGMGVVKGEVNIKPGAFNTQGKVSGLNFYLWDPNLPVTAQHVKIPVLTPDGKNPIAAPKGFRALSREGASIAMTINGFKTKIDSLNSYLNGDSLKLGAKLICSVPGFSAPDQQVDVGSIVIHPNGVDAIVSKQTLAIPLKSAHADWSINAQEWSFVNDIVISKGVFKAGKIDVPIKTLTVQNNALAGKQFDLTSLNIAKILPLRVTGTVVVDYNASDSWYVFLSPGSGAYSSYFAHLPGTEDTAKVYLQSVKATSAGKMHIASWANQPAIRIHSVAKLQPEMIDFYDEAVSIAGLTFDPVIPDYSGTSSVKFETNTGSAKLTIMPFGIAIPAKGVLLNFGVTPEQALSQVLNQHGFKSYGTVSEPGKFKELKAWLYHTKDSTSIILENPSSPDKKSNAWQTLAIGASNTSLDKLTGRMGASNGAWELFGFEGDLAGTKGVDDNNKRMSFVVKGEVEADNQKIGIKNVPTPFGDLKLTYDFDNQRLDGTMQIDQDANGVKLYGAANLRIDADGWYFYAGGSTTIPGGSTVKMAMLFGDYPRMEPFVKDEFAKASYKKTLPEAYAHSISGFLIAGSAAVPILVPNFQVNLGVVSIDIGHLEGLDTRIWCSFDGDGSEFGVGNIGFVNIWAIVQSITCTQMGGSVGVDVGYTGTYNTSTHVLALDACTSISLKAWLKQKTPFVSYDGPTCIDPTIFDLEQGFDFRATIHMDSNGGSNYTVAKGTCHD